MQALTSTVIQSDGVRAALTWAAASPSWTLPFVHSGLMPQFFVIRSGSTYVAPGALLLSATAADVFSPLVATFLLDVSAIPGNRIYGTDTVLVTVPEGLFCDSASTPHKTAASTKKQAVTNGSIQSTPATPPDGDEVGDLRRLLFSPYGVPAAASGTQVATGRVGQTTIERGIVRTVGDREVLA